MDIPRWYGISWALGFYLGFLIVNKIFKKEKIDETWIDKTFLYVLVGGILGARIGHCFFYDWDYYSQHPLDVFKVWEGGLASHGGVIGVAIAMFVLSKFVLKVHMLWIVDRIVVPSALAGGLIRLGNLFNHEILGKETTSNLGFKFLRDSDMSNLAIRITDTKITQTDNYGQKLAEAYRKIELHPEDYSYYFEQLPIRYPAQLIEALCYFGIFGLIFFLYWRTNAGKLQGFLTGIFFTFVFGTRFLIEYIKENQGGTDTDLDLFNMGQRLSIPLVLLGLFLIFRKIKELKKEKG